jgi:hypothetical protein
MAGGPVEATTASTVRLNSNGMLSEIGVSSAGKSFHSATLAAGWPTSNFAAPHNMYQRLNSSDC